MLNAKPLTIVGAGLVGSLLATYLARRGQGVRLFERRPDMRQETISAGRSINLAVSVRGLHALKQIGLETEVLRHAVAMHGRMIHAVDGALSFQRYGKDDSECIHSVSRGELNKLLLSTAEATGGVELFFDHRAMRADLDRGRVEFKNQKTGETRVVDAPSVIGTDGSASVIRAEILRRTGARSSETELDYGYKELVIPPAANGSFRLEKNALHIWPRGTYMLIALPNQDGSFTCTLFLPHTGRVSFESLATGPQVSELFLAQFPDVLPLLEDLEKTFLANPIGHMVTIKSDAWHWQDKALLVGDAAHAIVPFFGQGMNCGFEDCSVLGEQWDRSGFTFDAEFLAAFQGLRKTNADAIADLAVENLVEMRDKVGDPRFLLEKAVERVLQAEFPGEYVSRYGLVTFSRVPYRFAYEVGMVQAEILAELCAKITTPEQVDRKRAHEMIRTRITPLFENLKQGVLSHGS